MTIWVTVTVVVLFAMLHYRCNRWRLVSALLMYVKTEKRNILKKLNLIQSSKQTTTTLLLLLYLLYELFYTFSTMATNNWTV